MATKKELFDAFAFFYSRLKGFNSTGDRKSSIDEENKILDLFDADRAVVNAKYADYRMELKIETLALNAKDDDRKAKRQPILDDLSDVIIS